MAGHVGLRAIGRLGIGAAWIAGMGEAGFAVVCADDEHGPIAHPVRAMQRFDILRPIHGRGAQQARGFARAHQHIALIAERNRPFGRARRRVRGVQRQSDPFAASVFIEARGVERAFAQKIAVGEAIAGIVAAARNEFVDELIDLIVTGIDGDASIARQRRVGAFGLASAKRGALARRPGGIVRIDLDNPAIKRRAVWIYGRIELAGRDRIAWPVKQRRAEISAIEHPGGLFARRDQWRRVCMRHREVGVEILLGG